MKHFYLFATLTLWSAAGCADFGRSRLFNPGPAWYQQNQAERFDPYPTTDVAPDIQARPLAYIRPAPENERNQNAETFYERYHQPPPPGVYRPQRATTTQAAVPYTPLPAAPGSAPVFVP